MSRVCELTGKSVLSGHKVSHSEIKTKRRFLPNLQNVTLLSELLGQNFKFKISARALKTVEFKGGLDKYLLNAKDAFLSRTALRIKKKLREKVSLSNAN